MDNEFQAKLQTIIDRTRPKSRAQVKKNVQALLDAGVDSVASLLALLQDERLDTDLRITACWMLGQVGDKRAAAAMLNAFRDGDVRLSWQAATSLSMIGSKRAVRPMITELLEGKDANKRSAAAYVLGHLYDERAIEPLLRVLSDNNEHPTVRGHATEALAGFEDGRAFAPLIAALKDPSAEVRFWSAFALGELGDKRALSELRQVAATDKSVLSGWWAVRKEASDAMKRIYKKSRWRGQG